MKNVIALLCILVFVLSNCKNEMEDFTKDFRVPDLQLEFELVNSPTKKSFSENCFSCLIIVNEQEPSLSSSTCGGIEYSTAYQNNTLTIHFESDVILQNVISFSTLSGNSILGFQSQFENNLLQILVPQSQIENVIESGFQLQVEICIEKTCENVFNGFVEFPTQSIYVDYPNLNYLIPICENQLCVEIENGYFSIRSSTLKICSTETVKVSSFMCPDFSPTDIQFFQSSGFTEIRCYFSAEFWECWENPVPNQIGYFSISISFEHQNPIVI